jgi:hypothetical protein
MFRQLISQELKRDEKSIQSILVQVGVLPKASQKIEEQKR